MKEMDRNQLDFYNCRSDIENKDSINPLVSIITPCYNGGKFLDRFFLAILGQTYPKLELIFVDDGSTDQTAVIVEKYKKKFLERKCKLIYFYQKNQGQAVALNQGLKLFTGEYFMWMDSDDVIHPDNVSTKMQFLIDHKEFGFVSSSSRIVEEDTFRELGVLSRKVQRNKKDTLFEDLILERNAHCANCGFLVRKSAFLRSIPTRKIFESRGGQNWQMLVPLAYYEKCGYIEKILSDIVERKNSHSHSPNGLEQKINRMKLHEEILIETIKSICELKEKEMYIRKVNIKYAKKGLRLAWRFKNKEKVLEYYSLCKGYTCIGIRELLIYAQVQCIVFNVLGKGFRFISHPIRTIRRLQMRQL